MMQRVTTPRPRGLQLRRGACPPREGPGQTLALTEHPRLPLGSAPFQLPLAPLGRCRFWRWKGSPPPFPAPPAPPRRGDGRTGGPVPLPTGDRFPLTPEEAAGEAPRTGGSGKGPTGPEAASRRGRGAPFARAAARAGLWGRGPGAAGSGDVSLRPRPRPGYIRGGVHAVGLFRYGFAGALQLHKMEDAAARAG
ncbi:unnamed protein product [Bubo scandiacus]